MMETPKNFQEHLMRLRQHILQRKDRKMQTKGANCLRTRARKSRKGLSLVEMAIVLLIIGTIMGVVLYNLTQSGGLTDKAVKIKVQNDAAMLMVKLGAYERNVGQLEEDQSLQILTKKNPEFPGYRPMPAKGVQDPWGNYYFLKKSEDDGTMHICTLGKDKQAGGLAKNADFCITDETNWPIWMKTK